jgi:hypothetical protein
MSPFHGKLTRNIFIFSWAIFTYGNITMVLMIKIPMHLCNFFPHALNKATQPVLGKFPTKVKISISNRESPGTSFEEPYRKTNLHRKRTYCWTQITYSSKHFLALEDI